MDNNRKTEEERAGDTLFYLSPIALTILGFLFLVCR